ncbi:MAG: NUDIX domain-containing protein, partial [Candidatus Gastranaerophilales bacterium]|nr:NUDIX domain-containing protein [Candidatus Gastranaerophilales bacterium]
MILYETKFLTLKAAMRKGLPDWIYVTRPNAKNVVVILPVIETGNNHDILFLKTKRPPLIEEKTANFCIEFPAGLVGDEHPAETTENALYKELLEETGHKAESFEICAEKVSSSAGLTNETYTIAIAHIKDKTLKARPVSDNGVIHERMYVQKNEIKDFLYYAQSEGCA